MDSNQWNETKIAAKNAITAVLKFISDSKGKPPEVSLSKVLEFQKLDGTLDRDGIWGPNTATAAAYYAGTSVPPVAPTYLKNLKITWKPQVVTTPSSVISPIVSQVVPSQQAKAAAAIVADTPKLGQDLPVNKVVDIEQALANGLNLFYKNSLTPDFSYIRQNVTSISSDVKTVLNKLDQLIAKSPELSEKSKRILALFV